MKTAKRLITLTAVLALLLCLAACAKKPNFTQKITAGNIEVTVRDDMKEDPSITSKAESYITCYFWNGYGVNVGSVKSTDYKIKGMTAEDFLQDALKDQKNVSGIMKYGEIPYMEYTIVDDGKDYLFTNFVLEEGYEFYLLEFYTLSKTSDKYMDQYKTILNSVRMIEEPAKTTDIVIKGVKLTVDGDAYTDDDTYYTCGRYLVAALSYNVAGIDADAAEFGNSLLEDSKYTTADGQPVTEVQSIGDGMAYFEGIEDNMASYHYIRIVDDTLVYVIFFTNQPVDTAMKAEFSSIASSATLA